MNSSNLAVQLEPDEDQPAPAESPAVARPTAPESLPRQARPRTRSSFAFRAIVIRDQGMKLFRFY